MSKTRTISGLALAAAALVAGGCNETTGPVDADGMQAARVSDRVYAQQDRFGLPAIATVFIPTSKKDAYNMAIPSNDRATFKADVVAKLLAFGNTPQQADALANAVQPDVQPIDLTQPTRFLNGRRLPDDVITAELGLIFGANTSLNDDHVDRNDRFFLDHFPYLAGPHQ